MRLLFTAVFVVAAMIYGWGAWISYEEERGARGGPESTPIRVSPRHPETNLRLAREALQAGNYTDDVVEHVEWALAQSPSFYQPPFLLAALYANRLEKPELIRDSFQIAVRRFPSNGRLRFTFAEWLLTPRQTAPYRAYREGASSDSRAVAIEELREATRLEPELAGPAILLLVRFRVPPSEWFEIVPRTPEVQQWILQALDRTGDSRLKREVTQLILAQADDVRVLSALDGYARSWRHEDLAFQAAQRWREVAVASNEGAEVVRASASLARHQLGQRQRESAFALVRESLDYLETSGQPRESRLELLCLTGQVYLEFNQIATAEALFAEAAALAPLHLPAQIGLATTSERSGDDEAAIARLRRVLEMDPNHAGARSTFERLLAKRQ